MENNMKCNIDKLHMSFWGGDKLAATLSQLSIGDRNCYGMAGEIELIVKSKSETKEEVRGQCIVNKKIEAELRCGGQYFGDFIINPDKEFCTFKWENKALYEEVGKWEGEKYNAYSTFAEIWNWLGLRPKAITTFELAIDVSKYPKIRPLLNDKDYKIICNGKIVSSTKEIPNYKEIKSYIGDTRPSIYFGQRKTKDIQCKVYDKSREIDEKSETKEYIKDWNELKHIYRIEVSGKSDAWKDWVKYLMHTNGNLGQQPNESDAEYNDRLIWMLHDETYRLCMFDWMVNKLLYFRSPQGEKITIIDILSDYSKPQKNPHTSKL